LQVCTREMVLVHDGARPGVTPELCARVLRAARDKGAATAFLPVADSTARVLNSELAEVLPRAELGALQTPQAFRTELLRRAHLEAGRVGRNADDDAALVLALGAPVATVAGDPRNLKVTRTEDILALRAWLGNGAWARP
ncbi:MAG: 2-C-methyl-D-erythritol 4-phosphate cytidylyltransferase, partial [Candidatus Dormiibacterota bacterium]